MRARVNTSKRWVVKIGSSILTDEGRGLDHDLIHDWCEQIAHMTKNGVEIVLVSSGSIAEGMSRLGWHARPAEVHRLQAAAAVGQMGLIQAYESGFNKFAINTAQVLLTHEDLANRNRYLNARSTLRTLLKFGVIPVVNENDTVTTDEIRFGDNDTLAALVANLIEADVMVLLTDQLGLYDRDPRNHTDAILLERVDARDPELRTLAGSAGSAIGSGGMLTKVMAAERAADSGTTTIIAAGRESNILTRLHQGEAVGTMLTSDKQAKGARKQWLSSQLRSKGSLILDSGACDGLIQRGASLLAVGVTRAEGSFQRGELVSCKSMDGTEIARGLINYSSEEARKLLGSASEHFEEILGYSLERELIHRDNLVLTRT